MDVPKDRLEKFHEKVGQSTVIDEEVALYLLLIDERPGVLVMDPDLDDRKKLKNFCREYDLSYHYTGGEGERGLKDKILRTDSRLFKGGFFIAKDEKRFEMLKSSEGRFYGFSDEAVGKFLGYPEDDIKYFSGNVTDGHIENPTREKADELRSQGKIKEKDLKFLELVDYVPRPEEENILKAINTGKNRHEKIKKIDEKYEINTGEEILRKLFRSPLN